MNRGNAAAGNYSDWIAGLAEGQRGLAYPASPGVAPRHRFRTRRHFASELDLALSCFQLAPLMAGLVITVIAVIIER